MRNKLRKLYKKYPISESQFMGQLGGAYLMREVFDKNVYAEGVKLSYDGIRVTVPKQYDKYLNQIYGNYMKYPPKKEREIKKYYTI